MRIDSSEKVTQLLVRTAARDRQAFTELYELTSATLFGVCLRMLRDRSEAEEVVQETYAAAWRRAESFNPVRGGAMPWLIALARNKAIDRLRHQRERPADPTDVEQLVDDKAGPAAEAENSEAYGRLQRCLEALEPNQKRSVREAFFTGATYTTLAARYNVPLGTMKSWIRRSLLQLRACLES